MNELIEIIRREISTRGIVSVARFMELALYCPLYGFYEQESDTIGRRGDYYTNVSTGRLFGELLAFQFVEWIESESGAQNEAHRNESGAWQIVEAGAHDGRLAKDILAWLRFWRPEVFEEIEYWIVEPSLRRQKWQQETLSDFAPRVRWFADLQSSRAQTAMVESNWRWGGGEWKSPPVRGVIFSNELLDAMPVHRFGWDARGRKWFEWGVAASGDRFVWARLPETPDAARLAPRAPAELLNVLPDGYTIELCPMAEEWWRSAALALGCGRLLTIDYGLTAEEALRPERRNGTLRAYHRHHPSRDVLENPGEQDITAHVNFSTLQAVGESAGLKTNGLFTQPQFLTKIAERVWKAGGRWGEWTPEKTRQFQTLVHPEHLGRSFRVLVQSRRDSQFHCHRVPADPQSGPNS